MNVNRIKLLALLILLTACAVFGQTRQLPEIAREFRGVWVATVDNIDFPSKRDLTLEQQRAELLAIVDLAVKMRLNAVIFQVRPMADAVYRSELEPWSEFLTGRMGKPQDLDPLAFLIAEAHKRGILVHAWFNPYRAYHPAAKTMSAEHVSKRRPAIVRQYGRYMWLDPTDEEAKRHSLDVIRDVVRRYDIDGVHFDDYFYPYAEKDTAGRDIDFPDDRNYDVYLRQISAAAGPLDKPRRPLSRDDWRRQNVDQFIEAVGREIKRIKPEVVYGISPFGIWQPMPEKGITGFNAYERLYADSLKWLRDGTVDYLSPQLYWETARAGQSFPVLLDWWKGQNVKKRFIWPGLAAYRIGSTPAFTADEIVSQIGLTRRSPLTAGSIFFSQRSLRNDLGGIQARLKDKAYASNAVIPHFSWIKTAAMGSPRVTVSHGERFVTARWAETGRRKAFWFVVYVHDKDGWSHSVLPASERSIALSAGRRITTVIVTAVDRLGNESR